jgi:hypothetical protein
LLARDLARLAPDAKRGVGEKSHRGFRLRRLRAPKWVYDMFEDIEH